MKLEYDEAKSVANAIKHGISFERVVELDFSTHITAQDTRVDYGEARFITYAMMDKRLHCLVYTVRGERIRPISFRKANMRERKAYEKEKNS